MGRQLSRRAQLLMTAVFIGVLIVGYAVLVPHRGHLEHFDQAVYERTVQRMHAGEGFYDAFDHASADNGVHIQRARGFRLPTAFLLWRVLPQDHLYVAYLVLVVGSASLLALFLTDVPLAAVAVTLYLLCAGRLPGNVTTVQEYLLNELWAVPFVLLGLLLWRQRRWWPAAIVIGLAVITREVTAPLLVGGLWAAHRRKLPRLPWIVVGAVAVGLYAMHLHAATPHLVAHGNDAELVGTGNPPQSIIDMMDWILPDPSILGLAVWVVAVLRVRQLGELDLLGPFLAIPFLGLFVSRPYWGLVFVPLCLLLATEFVVHTVRNVRRRAAGDEESSPPLGTRVLER